MAFKRASIFLAACAGLAFLSACVTDISYLGETYPPTAHVDVFFNSSDVKRPHKIMGKAIAVAGDFASKDDFQRDLMADAQMRGANAVLVESFAKVKTGQTTNWNSDAYAKEHKKDYWMTESGSANTQDTVSLQATVYYLKYAQ